MKNIFSYISKLSIMLSLLFLGSCDQPDYPEPNTGNPNNATSILIINTAPKAPAKVSLDNIVINENLAYTAIHNNGYIQTFGGQRLLEFEIAKNIPAPNVQLRQAFNTNTGYTVFLTDSAMRAAPASPTTDRGGVRTLVLTDNLTAPAAGKAGLRFINVAPASSSVSYGLYNALTQQSFFPTSKSFTTKAGTPGTINNLQNRSFRETSKSITISDPAPSTVKETFTESLTNFTNVDPGIIDLLIKNSAGVPVLTKTGVLIEAGKLYTVYVYGINGNTAAALNLGIIKHN